MRIEKIIVTDGQSESQSAVLNGQSAVITGDESKSKWLQAIAFILNYSNNAEDKPKHFENFEGSIEIIFHEAENKKVSIRCEVKDNDLKYFMDNAKAERIDIKNFLENLGFSKSYPFQYLARCEDIKRIADNNAAERLKLLFDCCGVDEFRKYHEKSKRTSKETQDNIKKIDSSLKKIDVQLNIFASDKNQKIYQEWVKRERELGHTQAQFRIKKLQNNVETVNKNISLYTSLVDGCKAEIIQCTKDLKTTRSRIKLLTADIGAKTQQEDDICSNILELDTGRSSLNESMGHLRVGLERDRLLESHAQQESRLYCQSIAQSVTEASDLESDMMRLDAEEEIIRQYIGDLEAQLEKIILNCEQNQRLGCQHLTVEDRDAAISSYIKDLKNAIKTETRKLQKVQTEIRVEENDVLEQLKKNYTENAQKLEQSNSSNAEKVFEEQGAIRRRLEKEIPNLNQQCDQLSAEYESTKLELKEQEEVLASHLRNSVFDGIKSMEKFMSTKCPNEWKERYFGLVVDNFTTKSKFPALIDIILDKFAFHHIVDSPETATEITKHLNFDSLPGEINFFALNLIDCMESSPDNQQTYDDFLNRITFDPKFRNIFQYISKQFHMYEPVEACHIIESWEKSFHYYYEDGAVVVLKSSPDKETINLFRRRKDLLEISGAKQHDVRELSCRLETVMKELNEATESFQQHFNMITELNTLKYDVNATRRQIEAMEKNVHEQKLTVDKNEAKIQELNQSVTRLKEELTLPLLTEEEEDSTKMYTNGIAEKYKELQDVIDRIKELKTKRSLLKEHEQSLRNRQNELENQSSLYSTHVDELNLHEQEMGRLDDELSLSNQSLTSLRQVKLELNQQIQAAKQEIKDLNEKKRLAAEKQKQSLERMETLKIQQNTLSTELDKLVKEIACRDQTITNADIISMNEEDVNNQLQLARYHLKTYAETSNFDVNLLDKFKNDRKMLQKRRDELKAFEGKIESALNQAVTKISESIKNTFTGLSEWFSKMFARLVPEYQARLELNENPEASYSSSRFCGMETIISEGDKHFDEITNLQKIIVAVAIVFSLQHLNPSPFYLFDAIEDPLPEKYQILIFECLLDLSSNAQLIVATNNPTAIDWAKSQNGIYQAEATNGALNQRTN